MTLLISISTFFLVAVEIWSKHPLNQVTRTVVMVVISLLLGTISLLLDSERDEDEGPVGSPAASPRWRWSRLAPWS